MKRNRYPGTRSFLEQDADIFFGRETDKKNLLQLIRLEQLLVLYGKSGLGKTSLLNAGILPLLKQQAMVSEQAANSGEESQEQEKVSPSVWHPLEIRFHAWHKQTEQSPSELFKQQAADKRGLHPLLAKTEPGAEGWWYAFKSYQLEKPGTFLLLFDQFEELFTYPAVQVIEFKRAFADLLNTDMPPGFKKALRKKLRENPEFLSPEERKRLYQPLRIKAVLSIRSDRLSLLDQLADVLPNILVNLYELKPLQGKQARSAIVLPGQKEDASFDTPAFEYSPAALDAILDHLSGEKGEIEPFQIQYICEHAEDIVRRTGKTTIEATDLGDLSGLFRRFYDNKIDSLDETSRQKKARRLLEDRLIFNGIRLSILREQITDPKGYDIPQSLLDRLEDLRLLRAERRNDQVYYEITHDTLVDPILDSKAEWLEEKRRKKEEQRRIEQEQALEAERRKQRKARWFAILMGFLALISIAAMLFAYAQQNVAESAKRSAVDALLPIADEHILQLEYDDALEKLKAAAGLQVKADSVAKGLLEIAFFHSESNNFQRALGILDTAALLVGKANVLSVLKPLSSDTTEARAAFRKVVKQLNEAHFSFLNKRYYPYMLAIPGGTFTMGCDTIKYTNCPGDEQPLHPVEIDSFKMAETETTIFQMALYCAAKNLDLEKFTRSSWDWTGKHPAIYIDWYDAVEYANWLSLQSNRKPAYMIDSIRQDISNLSRFDGKKWRADLLASANGFRLPFEAEWEYAAREGPSRSSFLYSGSDSIAWVAWYRENSELDGTRSTHEVAGKNANSLGLYDMSGNVWEWCYDWYDSEYYDLCFTKGLDKNPRGPESGSSRVVRGGSWYSLSQFCRVSFRSYSRPDYGNDSIGFRLAHSY